MVSLLSFLDPMFDAPPAGATNPLDPRTEAYLQGRSGSGDSGRGASGGAVAKVSPPPGASGFGFGRLVGSSKGKGRDSDPPVPASQLQRPPTQGPPRPPPVRAAVRTRSDKLAADTEPSPHSHRTTRMRSRLKTLHVRRNIPPELCDY